jgi:hypothetical protein
VGIAGSISGKVETAPQSYWRGSRHVATAKANAFRMLRARRGSGDKSSLHVASAKVGAFRLCFAPTVLSFADEDGRILGDWTRDLLHSR